MSKPDDDDLENLTRVRGRPVEPAFTDYDPDPEEIKRLTSKILDDVKKEANDG